MEDVANAFKNKFKKRSDGQNDTNRKDQRQRGIQKVKGTNQEATQIKEDTRWKYKLNLAKKGLRGNDI